MLRALTANLVAHERIETTDAKAKELRRVAERVITRAKRLGKVAFTPHDKLSETDRARRLAAQQQVGRLSRRFAVVGKNGDTKKIDLVEKVFVDLARRFENRPGGYTRIIKVGCRRATPRRCPSSSRRSSGQRREGEAGEESRSGGKAPAKTESEKAEQAEKLLQNEAQSRSRGRAETPDKGEPLVQSSSTRHGRGVMARQSDRSRGRPR
jgi:large subunit ribosomal protein L17